MTTHAYKHRQRFTSFRPFVLLLACTLGTFLGCDGKENTPPEQQLTQAIHTEADERVLPEKRTAANVPIPTAIQSACGGCHSVPQPELFTDRTWNAAIPFMYWLFQRFYPQKDGYLPQEDALRFYQKHAAKRLRAPTLYPQDSKGTPRFSFARLKGSRSPSLVASFDKLGDQKKSQAVLLTDMLAGRIERLDLLDEHSPPTLLAEATHPTRTIPFDLDGDGRLDYLVLELSTFGAKDIDRGRVLALLSREAATTKQPLLTGTGRIADAAIGDVDGDNLPDIVVADFGWQKTGGLRLLTKRRIKETGIGFSETHLDKMAGHIALALVDMDNDGDLDLVDGLAQHHERIDLWTNDGRGHFARRTIFAAKSPMWGLIGLRVIDVDQDGDMDVLHFNGDTLDAPKVAHFQGVHLLENTGGGRFESRQLAELPGVHAIDTGDFDGDGRVDIVAVANLPPGIHETLWSADQEAKNDVDFESVVLLRQETRGTFSNHSLLRNETCFSAVHSADRDGDGDTDIVLGPFGIGWSLLGHEESKKGARLRSCDQDQLYWLENLGTQGKSARVLPGAQAPTNRMTRRLDALRIITKNDPTDVGYQISMSDALLSAGRFTEANQTMKAAVRHNPTEATQLFESSCQQGKLDACTNLGVMYFDGEVLKKDLGKAANLYERACSGGEKNGCANLALMYGGGTGVPRDQAKAVKLLDKSCNAQHLGACAKLGELYAEGDGLTKDPKRANDLLERACSGGVSHACPLLAQLKQGTIGARPRDQSPVSLDAACKSGHVPSCKTLGGQYAKGSGVPRDMAKAVYYAERACTGGDTESCGNAGGAYFGGTGVGRDLERARALFSKACQGGVQRACDFLKRLPKPTSQP